MRKRTIAVIAAPMILIALTVIVLLALPVLYYGDMFLVVALKLKPKREDIPGLYSVSTDWGGATLTVRANHSFIETVHTRGLADYTISGSWDFDDQYPSSVGVSTTFKPFVGILHDKSQQYSYGTEDFNVSVIGTIYDEQDPDWGISFRKDKNQ